MGQTLFRTHLGESAKSLENAFSVMVEQIYHRATHPLALPVSMPTPRNLRLKRVRKILDDLIYQVIREHQPDGREPESLISMLLSAYRNGPDETRTASQVRDQVMTLLFAGHETTASALTWTWYLLARHREVERRLHTEVSRVLGGRAPTVKDLPKLRFTKMVIEESMSLYPPVWGIPRTSVEVDEIGGYSIPANSVVVVSQFVTHRHPDFWHRPETFDPERFSPECSNNRPLFAYFPFGEGAHLCIGKEFAIMEAQLVLVMVSQRYRLQLLSSEGIAPEPSITLRPRDRLLMRLEELD